MDSETPLFPLSTVLFPGGPLALRIFEPRYVDMVGRCMREQRGFGVVLIREGAETGPAEFHDIGTIARIADFNTLPEGLLGLTTIGVERFRVLDRRTLEDGLNVGTLEILPAEPAQALPAEFAHFATVLQTLLPQLGPAYAQLDRRLDDASWVGYRLAEILPITPQSRQHCLELADPLERLSLLDALIERPAD
jgi:Lon protease-like protein